MTEEKMDKILDRLPYFDGSGRRRFVAGGIILIGIAVPNWDGLQTVLGDVEIGDIVTSPTIAAGALLLVYAIGSLAEMFGELFLVRAASGIFWGLRVPIHVVKYKNKVLRVTIRTILVVFIGPILSFVFFLYGIIGRTRYTIDITTLLSQNARKLYEALPEKVARGLRMPVGDDTELALKFIIDELGSEADRKWARRLVVRAKDVAATITALQVVVLYMLLSGSGQFLGIGGSEIEIGYMKLDLDGQRLRREYEKQKYLIENKI